MIPTTSEPGTSIPKKSWEARSHLPHIVFVCLTPLVWLTLVAAAILLLTSLFRHLTASAGFLVEQQINVIAVSAGLALLAIIYTVGIVRALRKIGIWEREGKTSLATGGLWGLGIRAITIALPLLLLVFFIH